eukprot:4546562-Alexandrium_andersonii.AAC.1
MPRQPCRAARGLRLVACPKASSRCPKLSVPTPCRACRASPAGRREACVREPAQRQAVDVQNELADVLPPPLRQPCRAA